MYEARLRETVPQVRDRIARAAQRAGRTEAEVTVVAVTKGHPPEAAESAIRAGLRCLGENRVQELEAKQAAVGDGPEWHLIGHLQRNKVKLAIPLFSLMHSLDSIRLAEALAREAEQTGVRVPVLVQVNASGEGTKSGVAVEQASEMVAKIVEMPTLHVRGLMTMAPFTDEASILRSTFRRTREAFDRCAAAVPGFEARHLSMGMSNDFEIAIEEGSNMVRLGTILFGERVK
jgi:pyridoxal phosphate enzyme (YggS family)